VTTQSYENAELKLSGELWGNARALRLSRLKRRISEVNNRAELPSFPNRKILYTIAHKVRSSICLVDPLCR
jgi:hypothetical protein